VIEECSNPLKDMKKGVIAFCDHPFTFFSSDIPDLIDHEKLIRNQ